MISLTELEKQAMSVCESNFSSFHPLDSNEALTWTFDWMESTGIVPSTLRGVMASLVKKGLIGFDTNGPMNERCTWYTEKGILVCREINQKLTSISKEE